LASTRLADSDLSSISEGVYMKISARNSIPGKVTHITFGPVSAEVTINIAPGIDIVSVISATSAKELKLTVGAPAFAVIKASSVMVGVEHA
jgi:molybdopterin-binding protein